MSKLDTWIDNKIVQNAFIWFFLFLTLLTTIQGPNRVTTTLFIILLLAPVVYINNLFILPLLRKKLPLFIGLFFLNTIVFTIFSVVVIKTVTKDTYELRMFINFFGILILALVFASAIKMARDSFTRRQQEHEAELKLLKAQLNPHFLFNTLNNLYGLSVMKSDKLPDLMLKLSDLLRYSLYETKEMYVPLEKEITYLENYMSLEKIRLEDQTEIIFENRVSDATINIAPMLFIVFVENAFKHLEFSTTSESRVFVSIDNSNDQLHFTCANSFRESVIPKKNDLEKGRSGIGLQNVIKRLELMYPDKHRLEIQQNDMEYKVTLSLDSTNL